MRFCTECDNILIPRKGKLYCKACEKEYKFESEKDQEDYKIVKKMRHDEEEVAPIVIKSKLNGEKISGEDRKAFEEFFSGGEESGY